MDSVTADDLDEACTSVTTVLRTALRRDWRATAGTGIWTARATAEHLGETLVAYAAQLVVQPPGRYASFVATAGDAQPVELLEFVRIGAGVLGATVRTADPETRAFHPSGMADPEGFAGMGCVELLVHGEDIARGLGLALDPPRAVCERVLARMFPDLTTGTTDAWEGLLWATGRIELPDHERRTSWRWRGAPLEEPVSPR
jgi:uncharacterized protein (TIGR03083 family)